MRARAVPSTPRTRRVAVLLALVLATTACSPAGGRSAEGTGTTLSPADAAWAAIDDAMAERVDGVSPPGGALLVVREGVVLFDHAYGGAHPDDRMPIWSASKWLAAATILALVDEGRLTLDDPIRTWWADVPDEVAGVTVRQLLAMTSGIANEDRCVLDRYTTLEQCATDLLAQPPVAEPGTRFEYGNTSMQVLGRLAEIVTATPWATVFRTRIGDPVGMHDTAYDALDGGPTANPAPGVSATSTLSDYARFCSMLLANGSVSGRVVLSPAAVDELLRLQTAGVSLASDLAASAFPQAGYGLGDWIEIAQPDGRGIRVSSPGAIGFYPWIDRELGAFAIVAVHDDSTYGSGRAVGASRAIVEMLPNAITTSTGAAGADSPGPRQSVDTSSVTSLG